MIARLTAPVAILAALATVAVDVAPAAAGGMYLPIRGVRASGRAGAIIAGVDDVSALWINPAGLAKLGGASGLVDATFVGQQVTHTRVDSGGNTRPARSPISAPR